MLTVFLFAKVMTEKTVLELLRHVVDIPRRLPRVLNRGRRP
jgi:hypothetical protein